MIKRTIIWLLCMLLMFSLFGCGKSNDAPNTPEAPKTTDKPETPVLRCYNKADLVEKTDIPIGEDVVAISAKSGAGLDELKAAIEKALGHSRHHVVVTLPYSMGGMVETLHSSAQVLSVDYTAEGIQVETIVDPILYGRLREYITKEC